MMPRRMRLVTSGPPCCCWSVFARTSCSGVTIDFLTRRPPNVDISVSFQRRVSASDHCPLLTGSKMDARVGRQSSHCFRCDFPTAEASRDVTGLQEWSESVRPLPFLVKRRRRPKAGAISYETVPNLCRQNVSRCRRHSIKSSGPHGMRPAFFAAVSRRSLSKGPSMRNSQKGFSLLETLVVASIAGTLAAVTIPNLSGALNAHRLQGGLRTTVGVIRVARSAAISRNVQGRVTVSGDGKTLTVEVNRPGTGWTTIGTARALDGGVSVSSVSPANGLL